MYRKLVLAFALIVIMADVSSLVLRPVSEPLMKAGKSLGLAGEALVSITEKEPLACYGGALSAAGASLRNAGDCLAQCGATCRNKFGAEIAGDELRGESGGVWKGGLGRLSLLVAANLTLTSLAESAVCLEEARAKLRFWVEAESTADNEQHLKVPLEATGAMGKSSEAAEMAGRIIFSQGQGKGKASEEEKGKQEVSRGEERSEELLLLVHSTLTYIANTSVHNVSDANKVYIVSDVRYKLSSFVTRFARRSW